jgi:hypothetical protein
MMNGSPLLINMISIRKCAQSVVSSLKLEEMLAKKLILIAFLVFIDQNDGYYYMHSTDRHRHLTGYDCLSILSSLMSVTEDDYCRRDDEEQVILNSGVENTLCFNGTLISFDDLRAESISSSDLLLWYAPIDVIDQFQFFLDNDGATNDPYFWCNCSSEVFGARCEYTFEQHKLTEEEISNSVVTSRFYFVADQQYTNKVRTSNNQWKVTNGTCYLGLPECNRNRIICLHWNQVCDGK